MIIQDSLTIFIKFTINELMAKNKEYKLLISLKNQYSTDCLHQNIFKLLKSVIMIIIYHLF